MKLHRLTLRNYRGITFRDIEFPDRGIVVVSGANEIGKSSMIEALDLLLDAKDRSGKKEVKQVKPTHVDEGAEVTAEISTGPYRFTYFKRYHKRPVTELTVTAPAREQWTGDEAHDRVLAILAETVDVRLWEAQRVLQASATSPVDLSGCDALSRALDVAAGQSVSLTGSASTGSGLSGSEPLLIDRIDGEFKKYFTSTGRPTGEWAAAGKHRQVTADTVEACRRAVAEIDEAVARHGTLTSDLAAVAAERDAAVRRLEAARLRADAVAKIAGRLEQARVLADAAATSHAAASAAVDERHRLAAELARDEAAIVGLEAELVQAVDHEIAARSALTNAADAATAAAVDVETAQAEVEAARTVVEQIARRGEADSLAVRIKKIDATDAGLRTAAAELGEIRLTDRSMRLIEKAAAEVDVATAAADAASARIELVAATDVAVDVDGEPVSLPAGDTWVTSATSPTEVSVPGVLTVRVVPGAPAAHTGEALEAKRQVLARALDEAGVVDVAAARVLDGHRRETAALAQRLQAARDAHAGDDDVEALRARLAQLRADLPAGESPTADQARAAFDAAATAHRQKRTAATELRDAAATSATRAAELAARSEGVRTAVASARTRMTTLADRLERGRATAGDDELTLAASAAADRLRDTTASVRELAAEFDGAHPAAVTAEFDQAAAHEALLSRRHDELAEQLVRTEAELGVYGTEGRRGRLDEALLEHGYAEGTWLRLKRRAHAVMTLRSVMARHRDDARQRYVDPFRIEVERLGRIVFGADFEVEIDAELRIQSRTLDGCTVPYDSLSGGAKEQLGIVARLAGSALVAKEDGVPVVIDDALGFSDAERLSRMAEVFDAVGGDGQIIVLTCSPERYAGVIDAHRIELTAAGQPAGAAFG
ncbi:ATP-binding protein [Mycolicibacterium sediminis]|uniref:Endonuclease GajA/Old nuclease/RecF-like AAA domain-containing protein n=1 Tax=Mycolicibacterium sediminis TaxID=1286180 RepID=A0A7I7QXQ6_9MYCO|nr:ATP-binding protein [Mycolicibacterium sediminis]BBY31169.1 hypothetical protein MSEDJ_52650 [Mycolicibacterium sediminis]